jgi:hypothetical protein
MSMSEQYELARVFSPPAPNPRMPRDEYVEMAEQDSDLHKRTLRKLDLLLLPFLALLFLFNSLDKSNVSPSILSIGFDKRHRSHACEGLC